jgi:hypothetical protein
LAKRALFEGALHHQVDSASEERLQVFYEPEVAVEKLRGIPLLESHDEVQVAGFGIEPVARGRAEEVKPLYAVLLAERRDLRPFVFDDADHASTLARIGLQATGFRLQASGFRSSPLPWFPLPIRHSCESGNPPQQMLRTSTQNLSTRSRISHDKRASLLSNEAAPCKT